jgi:uncharacterized membrane protein YkvI
MKKYTIGLITGTLLGASVMMAKYPEIGDQSVPAIYLMALMNIPWLEVIFQIVVFGTFIETGAALLHAVNERLDKTYEDRGQNVPRIARPIVAVIILSIAIFAATEIGIIDLIGSGYNFLTLVFIAVLIVPLLTVGVRKIILQGAL